MTVLARAKEMFETLSTLFLLVAAVAVIWTQFFKESAATGQAPISDVNEVLAAKYITNVSGSGPMAIVEFIDFQCPFCARHATETLPQLKKQLNGRARYIVVNLPLPIHPTAVAAAEAAECAAEQGSYWPMHDLLFAEQANLASANLIDYASGLGLDARRFTACLNADGRLAKVKADQAEATRLGIRSTPTLFIGRMRSDGGVNLLKRVNGALSADVLVNEVSRLEARG